MAGRIVSTLDHVAVATPDLGRACERWVDRLGGGQVSRGGDAMFSSQQYRFANGARLELVTPGPEAGPEDFLPRFLQRFGATIHHVTLKVAHLHGALDVVRTAGLHPVDVRDDEERWQEAFLRPSQVGGLVVQIAHSNLDEAAWARLTNFEPQPPAPAAATLLGPRLRHPDLDFAASLWTLLGATVEVAADALVCTWPDSPLTVVVERGEPAGPVALRMAGTAPLPAEDGVGPPVEAV